jgi:hypothetical protein
MTHWGTFAPKTKKDKNDCGLATLQKSVILLCSSFPLLPSRLSPSNVTVFTADFNTNH